MSAEPHRTPTPAEYAKERAFVWTEVADTTILVLFVLVAVTSGSLTMLGESIRGAMGLVVGYYTLWLLRSVHRGSLAGFQYGTGKLEQFAWVVVGSSLLIASAWLANTVFNALASGEPTASPLGLSVAAIFNGLNVCINLLGWRSMQIAAHGDTKGVLGAELSARRGALVGSAILQITLTIAALAKDPGIVLLFDSAGAAVVSFLILRRGLRMIFAGLYSLFDQPAEPARVEALRRAIDAAIPGQDLLELRTRRGGDRLFVEVTIDTAMAPTVRELDDCASTLRSALSDFETPVDLVVVAR